MVLDDLKRLVQLYLRPRAAMSEIMDESSLLFAALLVVAATLVSSWSTGTLLREVLMPPVAAPQAEAAETVEGEDAADIAGPTPDFSTRMLYTFAFSGTATMSVLLGVLGLAVLYVPAIVLLMTILDRRAGSFGVALPRDYGSLAPCVFMSWVAAQLPLIGATLLLMGRPEASGPWIAGASIASFLYFIALVALAIRLVYGVTAPPSLAAAAIALLSLPCASFFTLLASPFVLFFIYMYFRVDVLSIQSSMGLRRSFKRHLEAATINPRDAEAHYQLGLIHQHRRQYAEAIERFQKAIAIDASEIDAHYQLGRIAREQGRHADAIRHFEPVVGRDPKHSRHEIWREVGATYVDAADFANARPMLERYVEQRPYDPEGLYLLGLSLKKLGEADRAREVLQRCIEATKTAPEYRRGELRRWRSLAEGEL